MLKYQCDRCEHFIQQENIYSVHLLKERIMKMLHLCGDCKNEFDKFIEGLEIRNI